MVLGRSNSCQVLIVTQIGFMFSGSLEDSKTAKLKLRDFGDSEVSDPSG